MDRRADIRDCLISRRAKIRPDQAGLYPSDGDIRRVPDCVARGRGGLGKASDTVLDAIARALMGLPRLQHPRPGHHAEIFDRRTRARST